MDKMLKNLINKNHLTRLDKLLLVLNSTGNPMPVKKIRETAIHLGLHAAKNWNISAILSKSDAKAIHIKEGWELTNDGINRAYTLLHIPIQPQVISTLRNQVQSINDSDSKQFILEAIACFEAKFYRASVVLSWSGAIDLLYSQVIKNHISEFNNEALIRDKKWKIAKNKDDLSLMKESNFLDIIQTLSIIGKNVKQELQNCLQLRNGCGHPNSLKIAEHKVASHLEILLLNVYSKFIN